MTVHRFAKQTVCSAKCLHCKTSLVRGQPAQEIPEIPLRYGRRRANPNGAGAAHDHRDADRGGERRGGADSLRAPPGARRRPRRLRRRAVRPRARAAPRPRRVQLSLLQL